MATELENVIANLKAHSHDKAHVEKLVADLEGLVNENYLMNIDSLYRVLQAFYNQPHHVMELFALRDLPNSPVKKLIDQFNKQSESS